MGHGQTGDQLAVMGLITEDTAGGRPNKGECLDFEMIKAFPGQNPSAQVGGSATKIAVGERSLIEGLHLFNRRTVSGHLGFDRFAAGAADQTSQLKILTG
jgi:hypothetical protein